MRCNFIKLNELISKNKNFLKTAFIKNFLNFILGKLGFTIKRIKYFYNSDLNLYKTINYNKIETIIDIGANEGQFAEKIFKNKYSGNIISFEPLKHEYEIIKSKILLTKNKGWLLGERCALGKIEKKEKLFVSINSESTSLLRILKKHKDIRPLSRQTKKQIVQVKKLDSFYNQIEKYIKKKTLLKIDSQGSELDILYGAKKILTKIDYILVEVSLVQLYKGQKLWLDVVSFLKKRNFKIWSVDRIMGNHITGQTYQLDIFFIKNNSVK